MFSFKRKMPTQATPFSATETGKAYDAILRMQRAAIEQKLQGLASHGYLTHISPAGDFHAEFGVVNHPCGCSLIGLPGFGVAFYVDMHGNAGWATNCPHAGGPLLSAPPPSAIIRPHGFSLH